MWTPGLRGRKKWKGHFGVLVIGWILVIGFLVMGWILVTGLLVTGGGVSVKIWQSVGSTLSCELLGGVTASSCPVRRKTAVGKQA